MEPLEREEEEIRAYVRSQTPRREKVTHAEKIATRWIYGERHDIWDVRTTKDRWWVITSPTNLYSQADFVSMDMALTYHLGVATVLAHRNAPSVKDDEVLRIAGPWRRWQEAADELNEAVEAEDFQSVGVRCRETLISMTNELRDSSMVPTGERQPKAADFVRWSDYIAEHVASGPSRADIRSHLKMTAKSTWDLAGWLTHAKRATRSDARLVLEAVSHTLSTFVTAVLAKDRADLAIQCPKCGSYKVTLEWDPAARAYTGGVVRCDACGYGQPERPRAARGRPRGSSTSSG